MPVDEELILNVLLRDRVVFVAFIRSIVRDRHLAEDVFQEVSMLALRHRDSIQDEAHLSRWLRLTSRHKALNVCEKKGTSPALMDSDVLSMLESQWREYDKASSRELIDALEICVSRLSPHGRQVVELRYKQGMKGDQIASHVNRSVDAVYKTISRIHRLLANCIREQLSDEIVLGGKGDLS